MRSLYFFMRKIGQSVRAHLGASSDMGFIRFISCFTYDFTLFDPSQQLGGKLIVQTL